MCDDSCLPAECFPCVGSLRIHEVPLSGNPVVHMNVNIQCQVSGMKITAAYIVITHVYFMAFSRVLAYWLVLMMSWHTGWC